MKNTSVIKLIEETKIIPVIAIDNADQALPLADALIAGGIPIVEITFRTDAAAEAIRIIAKERPEVLIGAGTVLTVDTLHRAIDSGAKFAVAPGLNPKVVGEAARLDFQFSPGIMTPSDIEIAVGLGVRLFKYFPAEAAGGIKLLKSISAPYAHLGLKFIPTGGITPTNMNDYLGSSTVAAIGGTWLAKQAMIAQGEWDEITRNCQEAVNIAR
ncbi:bifunctional 4-hydroxy-2-oxoglutarate aldolase/2-dehydro-3-deoxy-phosphogluconate aldolase [Candidatus Neomarinimicrobiota bacterium]